MHRLKIEEKVSGLKAEFYFSTVEKAKAATGPWTVWIDEELGVYFGHTKNHSFELWIDWTELDGPITLPRG